MKQYLPNLFTLLNLTSGSVGITLALQGHLTQASLCIWLGVVFDCLDGWFARLLQASSSFGKELDSLADLMTFGGLPASIMYTLIHHYSNSSYLPYIALLIPNFSAIRLAQFNIDTRQANVFIGFPTPANGLFISTLPLIITTNKYAWLTDFLCQPYTLVVLVILTSYLLIAHIQLMAFKFTTYAWYPNRLQYSFLLVALLLIMILRIEGLALSIILYSVASIVYSARKD
mmetsp:Transcript_4502/g.10191  ORF Transcript_4502/g.10191 Transcript_4502/m.10191 type:complete len:230 (-) Transcript_4502:238-927(-)